MEKDPASDDAGARQLCFNRVLLTGPSRYRLAVGSRAFLARWSCDKSSSADSNFRLENRDWWGR
jgi:hypothetical protein